MGLAVKGLGGPDLRWVGGQQRTDTMEGPDHRRRRALSTASDYGEAILCRSLLDLDAWACRYGQAPMPMPWPGLFKSRPCPASSRRAKNSLDLCRHSHTVPNAHRTLRPTDPPTHCTLQRRASRHPLVRSSAAIAPHCRPYQTAKSSCVAASNRPLNRTPGPATWPCCNSKAHARPRVAVNLCGHRRRCQHLLAAEAAPAGLGGCTAARSMQAPCRGAGCRCSACSPSCWLDARQILLGRRRLTAAAGPWSRACCCCSRRAQQQQQIWRRS